MLPPNLITTASIRARAEITSKKRLLESLAELLAVASPQLTTAAVFDRLLQRERLGSTGLGHGVALPHARASDVEQALGAFIQLRSGIDFDAVDNQPVDLAFALLVPEAATDEHLRLLASLAEMFTSADLRQTLRQATAPEELRVILLQPPATNPSGP
ncbi:MAG: PTS IIA-like nitrogen-regulatory protein PtsN [Chromatiaceae bacterium]|nr:MAG: PTS IIA-like nitrogen-regulatory protein PtsN [Chromatiaceae bacterium]